jgi:hypothetical protein
MCIPIWMQVGGLLTFCTHSATRQGIGVSLPVVFWQVRCDSAFQEYCYFVFVCAALCLSNNYSQQCLEIGRQHVSGEHVHVCGCRLA